jgi:alkanesulfonate monooxygenase SsuD/methylene tetrahydromethanopterin reductase-like flavin-dependent oxidoreductase (luciferase family)
MDRGDNSQIDLLSKLSEELDSVGYYSLLLVYHAKMRDHWIKAARVLNKEHKIKYMPAIRTYAITPEYAAMMSKAFKEISPNRLALNIVSGDIHSDENSVENMIWFGKDLATPDQRLDYTDEWMSKFIELCGDHAPEIVMGGHANKTKLMAEKYNATHLSMLDMYLDAYKEDKFFKNTKQMVALCVVVRETDQEAEEFVSQPFDGWQKKWTIYGSPDTVKRNLMDLSNIGITDIIINSHPNDDHIDLVHKTMGELIRSNNGIK